MSRGLQLSDIACYLPYGLKIHHHSGLDKPIEVWSTLPGQWIARKDQGKSSLLSYHYWIENKPILRPMSMLTSEIIHKGETFVPLIEIFKLHFPYEKGEIVINKVECCWSTAKCGDTEVYYNGDINGVEIIDKGTSMAGYNVASFDKLNDWMFDYRGLIDAGLAVSVIDIKPNPYE